MVNLGDSPETPDTPAMDAVAAEAAVDDPIAPDPGVVEAGAALFQTPQLTNFGATVACSACHGDDGSGGTAADIVGMDAAGITDVVQGAASHPPPTGRIDVRFPELTQSDIAAIAAFLSQG